MSASSSRISSFGIHTLVFTSALALYIATLSRGTFPGESAALTVAYTGLDPFLPLSHPIWGAVAWLLNLLPIGELSTRLNLLSAFCGAISVTLLYAIVSQIDHRKSFEESVQSFSNQAVNRLSGIVAASLLAVSTPFWIVSTRAHTASFDVAMLLGSFLLLLKYGSTKRNSFLIASVLLYGLGISEFATFILLLPVYGCMLLIQLWKAKQLRPAKVFTLVLVGLTGLLPYLLHAWRFASTPGFQWREFSGYWHVVGRSFLEQYILIAHGLPKVGWLSISIVSFVPWIIVFLLRTPSNRVTGRNVWLGSLILNGVLTGLAIAIFLNTILAPWSITNFRPLLVTPYLFIAIWSGYLAGYWLIVFSREPRRDGTVMRQVRRVLRLALFPLLIGFVGAAAVTSYPIADGRPSGAIQKFSRAIINEAASSSWLVSNGLIDDLLKIEASAQGSSIKILNSSPSSGAGAYSRYVASLFTDSRRQSLARVGLGPLLNEWFTEDSNVVHDVAVLTQSDFWFAGGFEPMPQGVLFTGYKSGDPLDTKALLKQHREIWNELVPDLEAAANDKNPASPWCHWALSHLGKVANNLGVFLEDHGDPEAAFDAYQEARRIDTNNLSALINVHTLSKQEQREEFEAIDRELQKRIKNQQGRYRLWALAYYYGYIRSPELYAGRGWAWAMSGKPNLAAGDMRKAVEVSGGKQSAQLALASLYFSQELDAESGSTFLKVLKDDPENKSALLGLARLSVRKGDFDAGRDYLTRLEELKGSPTAIRLERAALEGLAGNLTLAMTYLRRVVKDEPDNMQAWAAIATVARELDDGAALEESLGKLESAKVLMPSVRIAVARLAVARNDRAAARRHLDEVLRFQPGHIEALESILLLDVQEGQRDVAENHVEQLLATDPRNAFGNYVLGTLQVASEQYALAESSYRVSLSSRRSSETLNDLSWVLMKRGEYDEALSLIRESITMNKANGSAWDTLGSILLSKGDLEGAEKAFQQAIAMRPDHAPVLLNMAKLYEKKGLRQDALKLTEGLMSRPGDLSRESYEELRELVKRLRGSV